MPQEPKIKRVKILQSCRVLLPKDEQSTHQAVGNVLDLPAADANLLISMNRAEETKEPKAKGKEKA